MIVIFYLLPKYALGSYTFKFNVVLVCIRCKIVVYFRRLAPPSCLFPVASKIASTPLQVFSSVGKVQAGVNPDIRDGSLSKVDLSRHQETNQN